MTKQPRVLCEQRLTMYPVRAAAVRFLGIQRGALGNLWWLSNNPEIANFQTGAPEGGLSLQPLSRWVSARLAVRVHKADELLVAWPAAGYQYIVTVVFLLVFSANIFVRCVASIAGIRVCWQNQNSVLPPFVLNCASDATQA